MLGIPEVILSAAALALALAHVFPSELAGMGLPFPEDTNYLALPTALWVTLLFALGGVLLLDGIIRIAGSRE
jgi:hypothetical protein